MAKFKKGLIISGLTIIVLVMIIVAGISPITKYLVQKYDVKFTGRQITMDWVYVNPFTGYLHFKNVHIYEFKSDSVFLSVKAITANFEMQKLFSKTYELSELVLDYPKGAVLQHKKDFNFNDLVEKFSPDANSGKPKAPLHLNILNIEVNEGEFYYKENVNLVNYFIKRVNLKSEGFHWDSDTIPVKFSFLSGIGSGEMKGNFTINSKNKDYKLAILVHKFNLNIVGQYIKDLSNFGNFKAYLDADLKSRGSLVDRENVTYSGHLEISDFHFGKSVKEDYTSFDKLVIAIHELSPRKHVYFCDSVSLSHPYFKYERYDYLDNVQTMFGKGGVNIARANANPERFNLVIEIAKYIKVLSKNFLHSDYRVDRLAIYSGEVKYNDYSLSEKFEIELDPFTLIADSVDKTHKRVEFSFRSGIEPYGDMAVELSINPKDSSDFDLNYKFQKLPVTVFNPYVLKYTSFQLDRGTIELRGLWSVRNGMIKSDNHLLIVDPRIGRCVRNDNYKRLPLRFIMFFARERGNVIDYEIPISGNLKNPKFHFRDVILDALENVFVKPAAVAYIREVKDAETEIEESMSFKWEMRSQSITPAQKRFLERMTRFLEENPGAVIKVNPQQYILKEKEYILYYEARKRYFMKYKSETAKVFTEDDSTSVEEMSIKDSLFGNYLNTQLRDSMLFTIQDKCNKLLGAGFLNEKVNKLNQSRVNVFMDFFKEKGVDKQVKVHAGKNVIPYNGFSLYKISYKGHFPEDVLRAYQKMNELNNETPRKKFKKIRSKNKSSE